MTSLPVSRLRDRAISASLIVAAIASCDLLIVGLGVLVVLDLVVDFLAAPNGRVAGHHRTPRLGKQDRGDQEHSEDIFHLFHGYHL